MTIKGFSYNRACEYLVNAGIITEENVEIRHNNKYDLTAFFINGELVARYTEKTGKLEIK